MKKRCNGCKELKESSEFNRSKAAPDGLQGMCKECHRGYRTRNRERIYEMQRAREAAFKDSVIQAYGGKCTCCGESERAFLTFDHVNDDGAEHRKSRKRYSTHLARWAALNGYPKSLQLLCANCNMAKQFTPGGCPHQTNRTIP